MTDKPEQLRRLADESVGQIAEGYLRPWMCEGRPADARIMLIGANPATPFPTALVDRRAYIDALVQDGDSLHDIYLAARTDGPSPTRRNVRRVVDILRAAGAEPVLETNMWTLPTPSLAGLRASDPVLVERSSRVVPRLIDLLEPVALIVHGAKATRGLAALLGRPIEPSLFEEPVQRIEGEPVIFALPSLSPPPANRWLTQSAEALRAMAEDVATLTRR